MLGASLYAGAAYASKPAPYLPFSFSGLGLFIAGINKTGLLKVNTLNFDGEVGRRGTLSFVLSGPANAERAIVGQSVRLLDGTILLYSGSIESVGESVPLGADACFQKIECVDQSGLADRRLAAGSFEVEGQTAGDIASFLVLELLAADGVVIGNVLPGSTIVKAVFNYVKLASALDELSQTSGFVWYIDEFKRFHFHDVGAIPAPFSVEDGNAPVRRVETSHSREQFRSRQYLRAGKAETDLLTENFAGDTKRQTFTVGFEIAREPVVLKNGVPQSVGIRKVESGKAFYWAFGEKEITQDAAGTPLSTLDTLEVQFIGQFPINLDAISDTAVDERKAIEGGSGLYDEAEENTDISDISYATDYVSSLLRRFGKIPRKVMFQTDKDGLKPGMTIQINLAQEAIAGTFLITSVKASHFDSPNFFRYDVEATDGEFLGGWAEFYRQLEKRGKKFSIRESEVASLTRSMRDKILVIDSANFTDPINDGTDDPYTGLETGSHLEDVELAHFVGQSNVGKERFE